MKYLKRTFPVAIAMILMMVVAACGGSTATGSTPTAVATTPAPVATTPAPVATTPATASAVVKTTTASVKGTSETILTDASSGKTLYYFTPDTATTSACTGGCAQNWPALLFTGSGTPTSSTTLSGTLSVVTTANGSQVAYNGHLLYTFSGDSAAGQTNGAGLAGKWFVCTPTLK